MKYTLSKILLGFIFFAFVFTSCFKEDLQKQIDDLRTQLTTMQKQNDSLNNILNVRADSLTKALTAAQKRSDSLSNVLKTKSDSLSNALGITNANLAALTKSVDSIKTQIVFINGQLTQLNTQLTSINSQLTVLNQQLAALGGDVSQLASQYQALSASLQNINSQIAALQAEQLKLLEKLNAIQLQLNPPIDVTTGLIVYYPFSGNSGDSSGNGNHGVSFNVVPTTDRFNKANSAFKFNGLENMNSSQVNCINPTFNIGQQSYTIHMFFKPDNLTQITRALFNTIPHTGIGIAFNDNNAPGYVVYDIGPANAFWTNLYMRGQKNNYQVGTWYSFTLVKSGNNYSFYINGNLEHSYINSVASSYNYNVGFRISGISEPNVGFQTFAGDLDDFRLYNRALSQTEINYLATH